MSSEYPSHLHLNNLQPNATSFKRTFEQFGYDSGPPMTSALQPSGSGARNHHVPPGSSSNVGGNERNKRARSTSSSSLSDRSADSSRSSEYNTARSSASLSESSTTDQNLSIDQSMRSPDYSLPAVTSPSSTCTLSTPAPLPSTGPQDEDMSDSSGFSLDIPRSAPPPAVIPSTTHDTLRNSIERFNEFDSQIAALRRSHSRTPSWIRTASPAQSPLPSANTTTQTFEDWDWTHFGDSSSASHTAGEEIRHQFSTDATNSVGSGGTYTAVPRQRDSLSLPASDGLSRPGYVSSSSNSSSSASSLTIHHHPSYRLSPPVSSSSRANPFPRESNEFPNGLTGSPDSTASVERNNTDALDGLDGRQGIDHSRSGSSNLPWATIAFPRASPAPSSSGVATRSGPLDSVFVPLISDLPTTTPTARRSTHSGIGSRTMSSARMSTNGYTTSSVFGDIYPTNEERHRDASNTFAADSDPPPSPSIGRFEERVARARTLVGQSRNSGHPFSEVFATFDREHAAQDSGEAESSLNSLFAEGSTDHGFNERRRRMIARNHYNIASEDNEDDDDASHPERVREIIEGLHNARGLLERDVETARSLSGAPPRPEPSPPPPRHRFYPRIYPPATTVSSNSLVSESATEYRRTNARAQLRSEMFNARPISVEPPRDSSETATTRLRRLIANQTDSPSSSNAPSRPSSSNRTSDPPSRPFGFNSSGQSQLPRGGLDERERVRFAEILSDRRHPLTRSGNDRPPSRDQNHISSEDSLDNIFDPVFTQVDPHPEFPSPAEEEAQPPYVYRPPTPPLHSVRARSRSPLLWERDLSAARSHPFSNVNLDVFPPGIYRDSLRRSVQANQGRSISRVPEPTPSYEPPTFSLGNSDEDNDSDDMDSYFGVGVMPRRGRDHTAATSTRFAPRRMMPEPAASTTSLAFGVDSHDTSLPSNNTFLGSRGRIPPLRAQPSDEHLARHRLNEPERGLPSSPLDPSWPSNRRDTPTYNPRPSWEGSDARDRMRAIRDLMDRYGTNNERSDLTSRRDVPPPPAARPGNTNRHTLLPWRASLIQSSSSTGSGSPSNSRSSSSSSSDHNPYRNIADRPRERQEPTPPEERTPIRTLRQRAGLVRGVPRADTTRIRSMFRTMARRNLGDYMPDELFDSSYEGLLSLGETLGEARSKATPADVIASLPTGTYQAWAKEDSETRCPICLDDYGHDDVVTKLVECPHWLHKTCMEQWLKTANTCPVCRKKVKGSPKCPYKPNPASTMPAGSGPRTTESGPSGNHGRSDSTSGGGNRLSDLISRARRGSNAQLGGGTQQQSSPRVQMGDATPADARFNNGATHYHHHHYHYLHIHPPRPDQSHGSQFPDPYRQPPNSASSGAQTGTGPRVFPTVQNASGPRPNTSNRPALTRPTSWFGSMTGRANTRRASESTQDRDSGARFPPSPVDYESGFGRSSFTAETPSFHHSIPAPQSIFGAPPSSNVMPSAPFSQIAGSSSSSTTTSNRLDTYSLATGELQQPYHGTSRTNAGSLGSRSHVTMHPNNAGSAVQHLGSFNTDDGLDSRSTATNSNYVRPGGPGAGLPPWWR